MTSDSTQVPILKKWLIAARPWSFPISVMPVIVGSALAWVYAGTPFHPGIFCLALFGALALHSASNMISDVYDHRHGIDKIPLPVSGAVVRGWLSERQVLTGGWLLVAAAAAVGFGLARTAGPTVIWVGAAGVFLLAAYTGLKRIALGDLAVFVAFGPLIALGAWATQAGTFSWLPLVWMAPFALLVIAVLHANNWRDRAIDRPVGVTTMAGLLGDRGSLLYYGALIFAPFVLFPAFIVAPRLLPGLGTPMPWTFLLTFLSLPAMLKLWGRARRWQAPRAPMDFIALDGATAQSMLPFGLLCVAAIVLARWVGR